MCECGVGKIIIVFSVMVEFGVVGFLYYVIFKAGLIGFICVFVREVGKDGICVNCVMLGVICIEYEVEYFFD